MDHEIEKTRYREGIYEYGCHSWINKFWLPYAYEIEGWDKIAVFQVG